MHATFQELTYILRDPLLLVHLSCVETVSNFILDRKHFWSSAGSVDNFHQVPFFHKNSGLVDLTSFNFYSNFYLSLDDLLRYPLLVTVISNNNPSICFFGTKTWQETYFIFYKRRIGFLHERNTVRNWAAGWIRSVLLYYIVSCVIIYFYF